MLTGARSGRAGTDLAVPLVRDALDSDLLAPHCGGDGSIGGGIARQRREDEGARPRGWERPSIERPSRRPAGRIPREMKCARDARERRPRDGGEDALAVDFTGGDGVTSVFLGGLLFGGPILGRSCRVRPVRGATAECPGCCFSCVSASERAAWKISVGGWAVWLDRGRIEISETRKCFLWFENKCFTGTRTVIERVEP